MRWRRICALSLIISSAVTAPRCSAAEDLGEPLLVAPATRSVTARVEAETTAAPTAPTAEQLALHRYFYIDFPRAIERVTAERHLAEAELSLVARRLEQAAPARSFGAYGAIYTADLAWQIDYAAAQLRLVCLQNAEADLWRQRQSVAAACLSR